MTTSILFQFDRRLHGGLFVLLFFNFLPSLLFFFSFLLTF